MTDETGVRVLRKDRHTTSFHDSTQILAAFDSSPCLLVYQQNLQFPRLGRPE